MSDRKRWRELDTRQRAGIRAAASVQFLLAAAAWWDLAHWPAERVRGPKWLWALVIAVNFVGPVLYFARGRATTTGQSA
ncbi:PLD nuclease N-terminal domain-containing protein [Amycolatopsis sp. NPDC049159]|uniref:PLD nuclease N-terminal domain-containing protein n=1 Tax=Amycolatopsis sp. NPDC049159 TaxID=3157210 RepID=UPI0033F1AD77